MLFFTPVISIALTAWRSRGATPLVLSLVREMVILVFLWNGWHLCKSACCNSFATISRYLRDQVLAEVGPFNSNHSLFFPDLVEDLVHLMCLVDFQDLK